MSICVCVCVRVCVGVYMPMCVHVCSLWGCTCSCMCIPVYEHVGGAYACVCMSMCVHACVCAWGGSGSEDDFMELILSLLYVSSWFGAWVTRLVSKVTFSSWPFHNPKLDVILFQMIIQKHRFFYPFVFHSIKMGFDFLGKKGI